jgi:hypothetical protein
MKKIIYLVCFILLAMNASALVSYEYLENNTLLHFWNNVDHYYVNLTSGIQLTNVYGEFWTKNVWCVDLDINTSNRNFCDDFINLNMKIITDNTTYINITGTRQQTSVIDGKQYRMNYTLLYHLKENDTTLSIMNFVKNVGIHNMTGNVSFTWKIMDIEIGNTSKNNFLYYNRSYYWLNESFHFADTNISDKQLFYGNANTSQTLYLEWADDWYVTEVNESVGSVQVFLGNITIGSTKNTNFNWIDALCSWGAGMSQPNATVNITVGQTFNMIATFSYAGSCPLGGTHYAQYWNGTTWRNIPLSNTAILRTTQDNPYSFMRSETSTDFSPIYGRLVGNTTVRVETIYNSQTQDSSGQTVIINDVPPGANCTSYTNIGASTNLNANSTACYQFSVNNSYINCTGYKITGSQYLSDFMIKAENKSNVSVYNCIIENNPNGISFVNVQNSNVTNYIFRNNLFANPNMINSYALYISGGINHNMRNISGYNINNNVTGGTCQGGDQSLIYASSTNINANSIFSWNSSLITSIDGDGETGGCQATYTTRGKGIWGATIRNSSLTNININGTFGGANYYSNPVNITINGYSMYDTTGSYGIYASTVNTFNLLNGQTNNIYGTVYLYGSNIVMNNYSANGIQNSPYSNLRIQSSTNVTLSNINIINSPIGIDIAYSDNVNIQNILLFNITNYTASNSEIITTGISNNLFINNLSMINITTYGINVHGFSITAPGTNNSLNNISVLNWNGVNNTGAINIEGDGGNVNFINCNISTIKGYAIYHYLNTYNYNFLDCDFNKSNVFWYSNGNMTVGYSTRVNVTDQDGIGLNSVVNVTNRYGQYYTQLNTTNGLSPYAFIPEYVQKGWINYSNPCTNASGITCYSPYNFTVITFPNSINRTTDYTNASQKTVNLRTSICKPPTSGAWTIGTVCWIEYITHNIAGRNLFVLRNATVYINNANLTVANVTWSGNITLFNGSFVRGS